MPRVIPSVEGFDVLIYTRDEHPPAHVHVRKDSSQIKILLRIDAIEYHSYRGARPNARTIKRALEIVAENFDACWAKWSQYHERA